MQQLRNYMFILSAMLFVATPHGHGMDFIKAVYNINSTEQLNQQLIEAVEAGDKEKIKESINNGANVNTQDNNSQTPLHLTAERGRERGRIEDVRVLIRYGANVNSQDDFQITPLHRAVEYGNVNIAQLFIDNGANVNAQGQYMKMLLQRAASLGFIETAKLLIQNGVDVNSQDKSLLRTPLHEATFFPVPNIEVIKLLIHNNANVNVQDYIQETPLHFAAREPLCHAAQDNSRTATNLLIHNGANVNAQNKFQRTPLHDTVRLGRTDIATLLIHNGTNVNSQDCDQETPYITAQSRGYTDITALFDRIHNLLNGNIDTVITDDMPRYKKLYYAKAMVAYEHPNTAHHIISDKLKTLSDEEYADIMLHTVLHRDNIDHDAYNQFITNMRNTYEDDNKRQAVANTAWSCARYGYTAPHVIKWILNNYEDECRNFCDEHGNTIAHLSADAQLNHLLPRIMTLVMQNENHDPRNADNKTPVMLHHEIGNHEGVDLIKATIGLEQASRGYTKQYDIDPQPTRIISTLHQLGYIDKPHNNPKNQTNYALEQSRNKTPMLGAPKSRKSIANLSDDEHNNIMQFFAGNIN